MDFTIKNIIKKKNAEDLKHHQPTMDAQRKAIKFIWSAFLRVFFDGLDSS